MAKYRKKPVVIEAAEVDVLLICARNNWEGLPDWVAAAYDRGDVLFAPDAVHIHTLEGNMRGERGDWIIRGVKGELYPCKPDIFAATYEALEPEMQIANDP